MMRFHIGFTFRPKHILYILGVLGSCFAAVVAGGGILTVLQNWGVIS